MFPSKVEGLQNSVLAFEVMLISTKLRVRGALVGSPPYGVDIPEIANISKELFPQKCLVVSSKKLTNWNSPTEVGIVVELDVEWNDVMCWDWVVKKRGDLEDFA